MGNLDGLMEHNDNRQPGEFYTDIAEKDARTIGDYPDEESGMVILDSFLNRCRDFVTYSEIAGEIIRPRIGVAQKNVRADRLMLPASGAKAAGWNHGAIVIECKAPDKKMGQIICQCMDYLGSCFYLPGCNTAIIPETAFIWQAHSLGGGLGSITLNHRIGTIILYRNREILDFRMGPKGIFSISSNGLFTLKNSITAGSKAGSR